MRRGARAAAEQSEPLEVRRWIWDHVLVPGFLYLLAWVVLTWPQVTKFGTHYYCDPGDGFQNVWNLWWMRVALTERFISPWWTELLYWPHGVSLVPHTMSPLNGIVAIPFATFLPDWATYNVVLLSTYVIGGITVYWLCFWLTRARVPSLLAGAYYAFSPYHFSHTEAHLQLASFHWMPLFLLCFLRIFEAPGWKTGVLAGVALLLVEGCDWYYTLFSILVGIVITAWACVAARRLLPLCLGYRLAFACMVVVAIGPLLWFASELGRLTSSADALWGSHEPTDYSANLLGPLLPSTAWFLRDWTSWFWTAWPSKNWGESTGYLGWAAMLLAAHAFWTRRRGPHQPGPWVLIAVLFFALSLGPELQVYSVRLREVPMPYKLLEKVVPQMQQSGCPGRFNVVVTLATSVLVAMGLATAAGGLLRSWWPRVLLAALALFEMWPAPHVTPKPEFPDVVAELRRLPGNDAVHWQQEEDQSALLMLYQTRFYKPITGGYVSRVFASKDLFKHEIRKLVAARHYGEARRKGRFRYLVLPRGRRDAELMTDWKVVFYGAEWDIWVDRTEDWLPAATPRAELGAAERVRLTPGREGPRSVDLRIDAPSLAGQRVLLVLSGNLAKPVPLPGGAALELAADSWLLASANAPGSLFGTSQVTLDPQGTATVSLTIPHRGEARELGLFAQALVVCADQAQGFCASSQAVALRFRP